MLSFYNIWTVARFEMKTLLRSWFFRIFAVMSIAVLILMSSVILTGAGNTPWMFRGIPSSIPYVNVLLLNVVQAVIAVFLASDFLKRDRKLDTTEVVYMRSMTNADYVLGKTLGILIVFIALNLLVLFAAGIVNLFFSDISLNLRAYLYYPLLISIPTLVFIFGLSFLFMVLIRNQAVTFIVLLGYIAVTLFFLSQRFHHIFDYMAFSVPFMYSDFVGFGNLAEIILHRGIYLSLGLGFIFAAILLLRRLPQSLLMQRVSLILMVVFLGGGIALGNMHLSRLFRGKTLRQNMVELNDQLIGAPSITLTRCELDLVHLGDGVEGNAKVLFQNDAAEPIDRYVFRLNPGLDVQEVESQKPLRFDRNIHLLSIVPANPLAPGAMDSLTIHYRGTIDEEACYTNVDEEEREALYRAWLFNIDKRHCFVTPDYVLLSPENMWYPTAGHPTQDFVRFKLTVTTDQNLIAFSQGKGIELEAGRYSFEPEFPLPQLSLVIGSYERRSVVVDSVEYSLLTLEDHDYFAPYLDELGDTLAVLIREMKGDFERRLDLPYVYPRLSLIEVPIQFFSYERLWTVAQETVQPETVFLPEKGIVLGGADFKQSMRWEKRRMERTNEIITPMESQERLLRRFIASTLLSDNVMGRFIGRGRPGGDMAPLPAGGRLTSSKASYSIYPNYYTYVNHLRSKRWPIINTVLESFLGTSAENPRARMMRGFAGLTSEEKASLALENNSLAELIADPGSRGIVHEALKVKGNYLFTLLKSKIGAEEFGGFLSETLDRNRFRVLDVETLLEELRGRFQFDFRPYIEDWYNSRGLPGFVLTDIRGYRVLDNDRTRFQVTFKVSNPEPVGGLLAVSFRLGSFGGGGRGGRGGGPMPRFGGMGPGDPDVERIVSMSANQIKEIGVVLDAPPRMMTVNTLISKNLPSLLNQPFERLELNKKATPFEGERVLDQALQLTDENEIIVDNEDPGFRTFDPSSESLLKRVLRISPEEEEEYTRIRFWRPSAKWVATTGPDFYGRFIRSAVYARAGDGDRKVAWNAEITESGYYDVYCYSALMRLPRRRREGQQDEEYHFFVYHDDGVDEAILDRKNADPGWNFLGTYYLSPDSAKVELTNESQGRIVFADAVKWVKH